MTDQPRRRPGRNPIREVREPVPVPSYFKEVSASVLERSNSNSRGSRASSPNAIPNSIRNELRTRPDSPRLLRGGLIERPITPSSRPSSRHSSRPRSRSGSRTEHIDVGVGAPEDFAPTSSIRSRSPRRDSGRTLEEPKSELDAYVRSRSRSRSHSEEPDFGLERGPYAREQPRGTTSQIENFRSGSPTRLSTFRQESRLSRSNSVDRLAGTSSRPSSRPPSRPVTPERLSRHSSRHSSRPPSRPVTPERHSSRPPSRPVTPERLSSRPSSRTGSRTGSPEKPRVVTDLYTTRSLARSSPRPPSRPATPERLSSRPSSRPGSRTGSPVRPHVPTDAYTTRSLARSSSPRGRTTDLTGVVPSNAHAQIVRRQLPVVRSGVIPSPQPVTNRHVFNQVSRPVSSPVVVRQPITQVVPRGLTSRPQPVSRPQVSSPIKSPIRSPVRPQIRPPTRSPHGSPARSRPSPNLNQSGINQGLLSSYGSIVNNRAIARAPNYGR